MIRLLLLTTILCPIHRAFAMSGTGQQSVSPAPTSPFAGLIAEYLRRAANGHSPSPDEIAAMSSLQPTPDAASVAEAMPYLLKALANPDIPLHTFALTAIAGLRTTPMPEKTDPTAPLPATVPPVGPSAYKADLANALTPYIAQIAVHLTSEEQPANRLLAATILGGFTPNPPSAIYPPLLAYLKRDDAIGDVGLAVVSDLIQIAPVSDDTAAAITRFLRRSDQTGDSRANLADMIASKPNQSRPVNKALLLYLDSDDNSLRARVILSLPQLDLSADLFAEMKSRVDRIVGDPNENLQVVTAAKSIVTCWTAVKMSSGCPVY